MRKFLRAFWRIITAPFRFIAWIFRSLYRLVSNVYQGIRDFFAEEPEDTPLPDTFALAVENPSGLLVHLNALRRHLFRGLIFVVLTTGVSFLFIRQIMGWLAYPLEGGLAGLRAIDVTENIGTVMRVSLLSGFALAFPYLALEVWLFIGPGLKRHSRIMGLFAIPIATLFFIGGMAFAYYIMLPVALPFLFNFMGLTTEARPSSYFNFVTSILFWIGASFEFPLVIYFMASMGLVKARALAQQWRLAVIIIAIFAAAITPTIDPVNMGLVMAPMTVLYFLSIGLAYIAQPKHKPDEG